LSLYLFPRSLLIDALNQAIGITGAKQGLHSSNAYKTLMELIKVSPKSLICLALFILNVDIWDLYLQTLEKIKNIDIFANW
jgi:hypothetical protein